MKNAKRRVMRISAEARFEICASAALASIDCLFFAGVIPGLSGSLPKACFVKILHGATCSFCMTIVLTTRVILPAVKAVGIAPLGVSQMVLPFFLLMRFGAAVITVFPEFATWLAFLGG